jgi:hypothetical protein
MGEVKMSLYSFKIFSTCFFYVERPWAEDMEVVMTFCTLKVNHEKDKFPNSDDDFPTLLS